MAHASLLVRNKLVLPFLLFMAVLLSGCVTVKCTDCEKCAGAADGIVEGCYFHYVRFPGEQGCNSGTVCNNPGTPCPGGTCQTVNSGGACSCKCK
jgi:hypothetical protein